MNHQNIKKKLKEMSKADERAYHNAMKRIKYFEKK